MTSIEKSIPLQQTIKPQPVPTESPKVVDNSIMDNLNKNNANASTKSLTAIDKFYEKLAQELIKYNITVDEIKNSGLINKATGLNEQKINDFFSKNDTHKINRLKECLKQAIIDSIENNVLNYEKAAKTCNDYIIAISTGWDSPASFKKWNEDHKDTKVTISERLKLQQNIKDIPREELEAKVKEFFNEIFGTNKDKPSLIDIKKQLQTFGRCLINSNPEEKKVFLEVAKELYAENKLPGLEALFNSVINMKDKQELAAAMDSNYLKEITTGKEAVSQEDATQISKLSVENQTEEVRKEKHVELNTARNNWYEANKEILATIKTKIEKAEKKGTKPSFTEHEKQVLLEQQNFIIGVSAGEFLGTVDGNFSQEFKESHLKTLNKDAFSINDYQNILKNVSDYINNNQKELNIPKKEIEKLLNKTTDNNYSKISKNTNEPLTKPQNNTEKEKHNTSQTSLGFREKSNKVHREIINEYKDRFKEETSTDTKIRITKKQTTNLSKVQMINSKTNKEKVNYIKKNFDKSTILKTQIVKFLSIISNTITYLNILPTKVLIYAAKELVLKGNLDNNDIKKLNLSYSDKETLYKLYDKQSKILDKETLIA